MDDDYDDYGVGVMTAEDFAEEKDPGHDISDDDDQFNNGGPRNKIIDELEEEFGIPGPVNQDDDEGGDVLYALDANQDLANAIDASVGETFISSQPLDLSAISKTGTTAIEGLSKTPIQDIKSYSVVRKSGVKFKRHPTIARTPGARAISKVFITGDARKTMPFMTKFEYASAIGERATEIEHGARDIDPSIIERAKTLGITSSLDVAEMEIEDLSVNFPMSIYREVAPNKVEVWQVRELKLPSEVLCEGHTPNATFLLRSTACPFDLNQSNNRIIRRFALTNNKI